MLMSEFISEMRTAILPPSQNSFWEESHFLQSTSHINQAIIEIHTIDICNFNYKGDKNVQNRFDK